MKIGFVGLGQMGLVMAPHLLRDGWQVTGHDLIEPAEIPAGIAFTASLDDLVGSDVIITMLPDGGVVTSVVDQLITTGCRARFIDMSSAHPDDSLALAHRLSKINLSDSALWGTERNPFNSKRPCPLKHSNRSATVLQADPPSLSRSRILRGQVCGAPLAAVQLEAVLGLQ